jgi:hypothetical protein
MSRTLLVVLCLVCFIGLVHAEIIHDVDNDGIPSNIDNCPLDYNPLQEDSNQNGIGDICDPYPTIIILGPTIVIQNQTPSNQTPIIPPQKGIIHTTEIDWEQFCEPNWQCTGWSECSDEIMTRKCIDTNNCLFSYNKPAETTACEENVLISPENNYCLFIFLSILFGFLLIILIVLIILLLRR